MADVLVSPLFDAFLGTLKSLALREFAIAWGLETDLKNLENTASMIQAVLQDAEQKQQKSKAVKNWLKKLKDAAYDVENVIDEFYAEAALRKLKTERSVLNKVRTFFSLPNRLLFRLKIGEKIKEINQNLDVIEKERHFHLIPHSGFDLSPVRETSSLAIESRIFGRDDEKEKIISALLNGLSEENHLFVYAICGMGGLGKSTLANMVYNDSRMDEFKLKIWVCVSEDFHIRRLMRAILESIEGHGCDIQELDSLQSRLREKISGKKFLLILDDVWNEDIGKWDDLKNALSCGAKGSTIIITSRIEKIARFMASVHIHYIQSLSEGDSWSLFKQRAIGRDKLEEYMETIGKAILLKCRGVPLAINALGSLMCTKIGEDEWRSVIEGEMWDLRDEENNVLSALRLSYNHLTPNLRQCFTYCCVFPKDYEMEKDDLIQLWMANGYIPSKGSMHWYEIGEGIFCELVSRSFIQDVTTERMTEGTTCKIHDLMHDLASSIMRDECFNTEGKKRLEIPKGVRHLYFDVNLKSRQVILPTKSLSLRSLFLVNRGIMEVIIAPSLFSNQKHLRVFNTRLRGEMGVVHPISYSKLTNLRYLNLSYSDIIFLPKSIIYLQNLKILNLKHCKFLCELPKGIKYLKKLGYLDISECFSLRNMPDIGQLKSQQILVNGLVLEMDNGHHIGELRELNVCGNSALRKLQNIKNSKDAEGANLKSKRKVRELDFSWEADKEESVSSDFDGIIDALEPHSNLKILKIDSYPKSKLPNWLVNLHLQHLTAISLISCERCEYLPPLEKLPFLQCLNLSKMHSIKYVVTECYSEDSKLFPSLDYLYLRDMPSLVAWSAMNKREVFPQLRGLVLTEWSANCLTLDGLSSVTYLVLKDHYLEGFPDGLKNLKSLKYLCFESCDNLIALPMDALQGMSFLTLLLIKDCKKFVSLSEGVKHLIALQELLIENCPEMNTLPEGLEHLNALETLHIRYCKKFSSLPDCIGTLGSLQTLVILSCPSLTSLPDGLRNSALERLKIRGCPDLESRCKKETGADWPKIAHIPCIWINSRLVQTTGSFDYTRWLYTDDVWESKFPLRD